MDPNNEMLLPTDLGKYSKVINLDTNYFTFMQMVKKFREGLQRQRQVLASKKCNEIGKSASKLMAGDHDTSNWISYCGIHEKSVSNTTES